MGTWGTKAFENDTACDWAASNNDKEAVDRALSAVLKFCDDLDADCACAGIAAAELVTTYYNKSYLPDSVFKSIKRKLGILKVEPCPDLVEKAIKVLECVNKPGSELRELWEESDQYQDWLNELEGLKQRLSECKKL